MNENTGIDNRSNHATIEFDSDFNAFVDWYFAETDPWGNEASNALVNRVINNAWHGEFDQSEAAVLIADVAMAAFQFGIERGIEIGEDQ